eukprot:240490_1
MRVLKSAEEIAAEKKDKLKLKQQGMIALFKNGDLKKMRGNVKNLVIYILGVLCILFLNIQDDLLLINIALFVANEVFEDDVHKPYITEYSFVTHIDPKQKKKCTTKNQRLYYY